MQLPEVHGTRKGLDPHKIKEKQPQPVVKPVAEKKPRLGQGRAAIKRKVNLAPPSLKKETGIGPLFLDLSQLVVVMKLFQQWTLYYLILPKVPRNEGIPPYILLRNRPLPKPHDQLINRT